MCIGHTSEENSMKLFRYKFEVSSKIELNGKIIWSGSNTTGVIRARDREEADLIFGRTCGIAVYHPEMWVTIISVDEVEENEVRFETIFS